MTIDNCDWDLAQQSESGSRFDNLRSNDDGVAQEERLNREVLGLRPTVLRPRQSAGTGVNLSSLSNATNENSSSAGPLVPSDEQALIDQLNRGYVCPPDAGPMWRAAHDAGVDISLVEDALQMSPADRLRAHQRALNQVLAVMEARRQLDD